MCTAAVDHHPVNARGIEVHHLPVIQNQGGRELALRASSRGRAGSRAGNHRHVQIPGQLDAGRHAGRIESGNVGLGPCVPDLSAFGHGSLLVSAGEPGCGPPESSGSVGSGPVGPHQGLHLERQAEQANETLRVLLIVNVVLLEGHVVLAIQAVRAAPAGQDDIPLVQLQAHLARDRGLRSLHIGGDGLPKGGCTTGRCRPAPRTSGPSGPFGEGPRGPGTIALGPGARDREWCRPGFRTRPGSSCRPGGSRPGRPVLPRESRPGR